MFRMHGCIAAALMLLIVTSPAIAAEKMAKVGELAGSVMVQRPDVGPAGTATADTKFGAGDRVTCMADSSVKITFDNGTILNLVGPAEAVIVSITGKETRICLVTGLINLARARGAKLYLGTEYSVHLTVTESTGYAEVKPGKKMVFSSIKGDGVSLSFLGEDRPLKAGDLPYPINLTKLKLDRTPSVIPGGSKVAVPTSEVIMPPSGQYLLGRRVIRIYPRGNVRGQRMSNGGLRLIGVGLGKNEFARIEIGYEAVLYVGEGDHVVLDQFGNVDEFTGTAFLDRPIERRSFEFEPIKDAADSSTIRTRTR
jgi:hypothetical protein